MQAVFDHSWNLLASAERDALMRLSVFRGGWGAEEAIQVAGGDLLMLRRLVDKSLVRVGENGRYDLHELIRQYASDKLRKSGHETETCQRHFDATLALAARLDTRQFGPQAMQVVARFDQEHDNFRSALSWSLDSEQIEAALRLLDHLWFY
jgi:predicted ATPase